MKKAITVLMAFPFLSLTACQPTSTQNATAEFCGNLAKLEQAVNQMSNLTPASTVGDLRAADRAVDQAIANVRESAKRVKEARIDNLNQAYNNLDKTVNRLSNRQTLASAATSVQQASAKVKAAKVQLDSSINCPG